MKYPTIHKTHKGNDVILGSNGNPISSVGDYWQWAHGDLPDNAERGAFAEYLVSKAIHCNDDHRINWEKYDLTTEDGITVEVKSSAYIQTWAQDKLSAIRFGIQETYAFFADLNQYEETKKRQAQIYVFCILAEKDQNKINPLDTNQWEFYVLPSKALNDNPNYVHASSIGLQPVINLGAVKCTYNDILENIRKTIK